MGEYTTPGALLIKSMLPTPEAKNNFDTHRILDKKGVGNLVNMLMKHGGDDYHKTINDLSRLFFNKATEIGATTPLSDYENDSEERAAKFAEFEKKVSDILSQNLPKLEQAKKLAEVSVPINNQLQSHNLKYLLSRSSTAAKMANTGARGNPMQLAQGTSSPLMAMDVRNMPIPVAIKHSFAEGLTSAEHLAMSYGGRASTVMAQLSTEKPGALFKRLTPAVFHEMITEADCGTKNGVPIPLDDKLSVTGRYEVGTNKLLNEAYIHELETSGKTKVVARNPMTCEAKEGLCQKCYGLSADSKLPSMGKNVGIIAAQSVSEVLTQAMLSTKHQGGTVGKQRNPYDEASNVLNNPKENFQDEATIAKLNGTIDSINKTALNDWEISVGGVKHFVNRLQEPTVKVGDAVKIGDQISTGTINPRELVNLKGMGAGRVYIGQALRHIYSRNAKLDPRHFDIIARNMIKHVKVTSPGTSGFMPGDIVEIGQFNKHLSQNSTVVPLEGAVGGMLASNSMELMPGTILTKNHIDHLRDSGVKQVSISTDKDLKLEPVVPGLQTNKLLDRNWVSKLSFSQLSKTIQEAAVMNEKSPIHSTEPIAPYVIGNEFGYGENGKY